MYTHTQRQLQPLLLLHIPIHVHKFLYKHIYFYIRIRGDICILCSRYYLGAGWERERERERNASSKFVPSVVDVIKKLGVNLDLPKIKKLKKVCSEVWTALKCGNNAVMLSKSIL